MPPKRKSITKNSKAKGAPVPRDEEAWRSEIEDLTLNDDRWNCAIALIVETRIGHSKYMEIFNEAAEAETREKIFALSYEKMLRGVKLVGKSEDECGLPGQGICQFASKQIADMSPDAKMNSWLISRLIKFFVNRAKTKNQRVVERRVKIESEVGREIETMMMGAVKPNPKGGTSKSSKGDPGDAKSFDKANTTLRKRGEDWRDKVYVDDAPVEGPNLYVVLSGFHDPKLPIELINAGLPLMAIFRICRPGEEEIDATLVRGESKGVESELRTFWTALKRSLEDSETGSKYCEVVCQNFCPPEIPADEDLTDEIYQSLKKDLYRRISFLVYDLSDIARYYQSYMNNMTLQPGLDEIRPREQRREIYDAIMSKIPEECTSVSIILNALVTQIVCSEDEKSSLRELSHMDDLQTSTNLKKDLRSRIDQFNTKFDIIQSQTISSDNPDSFLIIRGDAIGFDTHHCDFLIDYDAHETKSNAAISVADFGTRIFKEYANTLLWQSVPTLSVDQVKMYAYHVDEISNCFDVKTCSDLTRHYLHLLLFDRIINGPLRSRSNLRESDELEKSVPFPSLEVLRESKLNEKHTTSETLTSIQPTTLKIQSHQSLPPRRFLSDSVIQYRKAVEETFECPELFDLIDTREMLSPGYASGDLYLDQNCGPLDLEKFDSLRIIPADVFSQIFFKNHERFDVMESHYFAPTDSVLICFYNYLGITEQEYSICIRTPVCLKDFSKYVMEEEKKWIEIQDEIHTRMLAEREALRMETQIREKDEQPPLASQYKDLDFILPHSIKGSELLEQKSRQSLQTNAEVSNSLVKNKIPQTKGVKEPIVLKAKKTKSIAKLTAQKKKSSDSLGTNVSSSSFSKEKEATETFIGYDIGNHRVQVSGKKSRFISEDGTVVKVDLEEWTYSSARLRIIVDLFGNILSLDHLICDHVYQSDYHPTFHLTTADGIVMSFFHEDKTSAGRRMHKSDGEVTVKSVTSSTKRNSREFVKAGYRSGGTSNDTWASETVLDPGFKGSWPSGLVVETLPGDRLSNPFYIKQSYISTKGPECSGISNETQRVFLRDGTVLVFLDDGTVRVLQANGKVVICSEFEKSRSKTEYHAQRNSETYPIAVSRLKSKRTSIVSAERISGKRMSTSSTLTLLQENTASLFPDLRILSSIILDPDGRRYKICDGKITDEFDPELVRTACDYEVGQTFTRRSDGSEMLMDYAGRLAVSFPDGSRITTGFVIEEDPVFVEWTDEECHRFQVTASKEDLLEADGFVSVLLTVCMEHKNYTTVIYDESSYDSAILNMPGDVRVEISKDDSFRVSMGAATSLKVQRNSVEFTGRMGSPSKRHSSSVYNLENISSSNEYALLTTTDSYSNVFTVDFDGKTSYKKFKESAEIPVSSPQEFSARPDPSSYRLFSVQRDLTAYEYLCTSARQAREDEIDRDETHAVFFHEDSGSDQKIRTSLTRPNPLTVSRRWLQQYTVLMPFLRILSVRLLSMFKMAVLPSPTMKQLHLKCIAAGIAYKVEMVLVNWMRFVSICFVQSTHSAQVPSIRPTNEDRRDLPRSTYSIPWDYLFPYGKTGNGISESNGKIPLKIEISKSYQPREIFFAETTEIIKNPGEDLLKILKTAMGRYWKKVINQFDRYQDSVCGSSDNIEIKNFLINFVRGGRKTFDGSPYSNGLLKRDPNVRLESSQFRHTKKEFSGSNEEAVEEEEIKWYKNCLQERRVPPYFTDGPGACFIWITECVDKINSKNVE